ncbi:MAG: alpha/beta hydrolase [Bdellovibrionales bacterium]|nr:alpha/beta hydrolase [Bdellovibrionales bacterium]
MAANKEKDFVVKSKTHKFIKTGLNVISNIHPIAAANLGLHAFTTPLKRRKKNHLLPKGIQQNYIKLMGKKIAVYSLGQSTQTVLFVHGWEGAASDFTHFFNACVDKGYRVLAVDLPGHGLSSLSQLTAIDTAKIIKNLSSSFGPIKAIIGHSFGAFSSGFAISQYKELKNIPFVSIGSPNKLSKVLTNFSNAVGFSPLQNEYIFTKLEKKHNIRIKDFELGKFVSIHAAPVLIVHDKQDKQVPIKVIDEIKNISASANFLLTDGLGHNRILKDKNTIDSIIKFIEMNKGSDNESSTTQQRRA